MAMRSRNRPAVHARAIATHASTPRAPGLWLAATLILGFALATAARADTLVRSPSDYLLSMDRDGDARISLIEYQDHLSRGFLQMDRNGDGMLSADELPAGARARRAPTLDAHRRALSYTFDRQDVDRSGFLDARELAAPPR
jgi:hypothetical protein